MPLNPVVLELAKKAYNKRKQIDPSTKPVVMIVDFSLPSDKYRMYIYNMTTNKVIYQGLVAHGKNSGIRNSTSFSDKNMSKQSSLGLYRTLNTYDGKYGRSLKIQGLEKGFNGNAESRTIVLHPAPYVSDAIAISNGRVGNSWGCFAVDPSDSNDIIDMIKNNGLIFAYYPDSNWLKNSNYLN